MKFTEQLDHYTPTCPQEEKDREVILSYLRCFDNLLTRDNEFAHFTASSFIVNRERTKTLLCYHNLYDSWAWTGGHADGDDDLLAVAIREAQEETGAQTRPLYPGIYTLDILPVWGHVKRGRYVSSHQHLNVTYLLEADESQPLAVKPDENSGVQWVPIDQMLTYSTEREMHPVYQKLIDKLRLYG